MIPCYLTNRDLLTPLQGMVADLLTCEGVGDITILDCDSSFPALLDWYEYDLPSGVRVVHMGDNAGCRALWRTDQPRGRPYFASDADLDLSGVPRDFLRVLSVGLESHPSAIKAGLSLRIDDLPRDGYLSAEAKQHERRYWIEAMSGGWFAADIDTTAAMYRAGSGWGGYGPAIRSAPPYAARHLPWYLTPETLSQSEEWRYYRDHCDQSVSTWCARLPQHVP